MYQCKKIYIIFVFVDMIWSEMKDKNMEKKTLYNVFTFTLKYFLYMNDFYNIFLWTNAPIIFLKYSFSIFELRILFEKKTKIRIFLGEKIEMEIFYGEIVLFSIVWYIYNNWFSKTKLRSQRWGPQLFLFFFFTAKFQLYFRWNLPASPNWHSGPHMKRRPMKTVVGVASGIDGF